MSTQMTLNYWLAIAPEIALLVLLFVVLGYNSINKNADGRVSGLMTAWGAVIALVVTVGIAVYAWTDINTLLPAQIGGRLVELPLSLWGNMIVMDPIGVVFRVMFLLALILTALISLDVPGLAQGEYFSLLIAATIGFNLMAVSSDLIMLVVALETASLSLYLLAGYLTKDRRSPEAGIKYFVYGAFASAVMLYGMSLLYGITGSSNIYRIAQQVLGLSNPSGGLGEIELARFGGLIVVAAVLLVAGFGFKVSAVPFHWWTPDVYEGAPTPVTGFVSTASKAAGFAVFIRVFTAGVVGAPTQEAGWWSMLVAICIITMLLGNILAIFQSNIKRMLAYSSIAQAGYVLMGLVSLNRDGSGAAMFYLFMYVLTNIAAFGVVVLISNKTGSDDMRDLYGLSRRSPYLGLAMMVAVLSLGGIPPTAGFIGKFFLFKAAVDAGLWGLALFGVLMAFVSLYYYLNVVKYIYLYRSEHEDVEIPVPRAARVALGFAVGGILFLGVYFGPALEWMSQAARWFFPT